MRSGTKNCYVTIERFAVTTDAATNADINTWSTWRTTWAFAEARKGAETAIADQVVARSFMRFTFDYLDALGITELDRIVNEGVIYEVVGLLPDIAGKDIFVVDTVAQRIPTGRT